MNETAPATVLSQEARQLATTAEQTQTAEAAQRAAQAAIALALERRSW